jgi:selenide,water dikinase
MAHALAVAQQGAFPGAVPRNLESYGHDVTFDASLPAWQQHLLVDPQTSGGLLLAVSPDAVERVLQLVRDAGCARAAVIGQLSEGAPRVTVVAPPVELRQS